MTETPTGGSGGLLAAIKNSSTKTKAISAVALLVLVIGIPTGVVLASGDDSDTHAAASSPAPTSTSAKPAPTTSAATSAKPAPKPVAATDPLTGGNLSKNPVFAVKIADTPESRPQVNTDKADIVYIEQVEGGLTRLAAIFHSYIPDQVEPVRSVRPQDMEMLAQFGSIGFVASGGNKHALKLVQVSPFSVNMEDFGSAGFSRDGNRAAPYNVIGHLKQMKAGTGAKGIGWTFNASTSGAVGAKPATAIHTMVGGTPVDFTYSAATKRWIRIYHGSQDTTAAGDPIAAQNVIVQFTGGYHDEGNKDAAGNSVWYTQTKGSGPVAVFRDGHRIDGTWSRTKLSGGTFLRDAKGNPIALKPGKTWVVLATKGAPLTS